MSEKRTPLSELGEFGLIDFLTENIKIRNSSTVKGVGDDAAILNYKNRHTVVTTDLLIEGVHFDLTYVPLRHLGYKAVVVNISDIFAMNAVPRQITVSIALSNRFPLEAINELYKGIYLACDKYGVDLIGGDTSSSTSGLAISITAIGEAKKEKIVYRNTAKIHDLICVSGNLGAAYMGLQLLEREKEVFSAGPGAQPDFSGKEYILERQLKPEARGDIVELLDNLNIVPTSMIDISDGLSSELHHICRQSGKGCVVYEEKLPIDLETASMAEEFKMDTTTCALNGGEDYELLFTISLDDFNKIKDQKNISIIGNITEKNEGLHLVTQSGAQVPLMAQGWNHGQSESGE